MVNKVNQVKAILEDYEYRLFVFTCHNPSWGSSEYKRFQNCLHHYKEFCGKHNIEPQY